MKTCKGIESYGCFSLGTDSKFAVDLFNGLDGAGQISAGSVMTIDLIKREKSIPYPLALKHCSLDQLGENVKRISKELFKRVNLED